MTVIFSNFFLSSSSSVVLSSFILFLLLFSFIKFVFVYTSSLISLPPSTDKDMIRVYCYIGCLGGNKCLLGCFGELRERKTKKVF